MAIFMWLMVMAPSSSYNMMPRGNLSDLLAELAGYGKNFWKSVYPDNLNQRINPHRKTLLLLNNAHGIAIDKRNNEAPELLTTSRMDSKLAIVLTVHN